MWRSLPLILPYLDQAQGDAVAACAQARATAPEEAAEAAEAADSQAEEAQAEEGAEAEAAADSVAAAAALVSTDPDGMEEAALRALLRRVQPLLREAVAAQRPRASEGGGRKTPGLAKGGRTKASPQRAPAAEAALQQSPAAVERSRAAKRWQSGDEAGGKGRGDETGGEESDDAMG